MTGLLTRAQNNSMALVMKWIGLVVLLSLPGQAWKGHLATLWDAQVACSDTNSKDCEPFLAEAVAVADVMTLDQTGQVIAILPFIKFDTQ